MLRGGGLLRLRRRRRRLRTSYGRSMSYAFGGGVDASNLPWRDQGVLNLANSPYAKLHSVPVRAVTIEEGFWSKRRKTNVEQQHPDDARATGAARAHGQLPPAGGEEQGAAEGSVLLGLRHLQMDRSSRGSRCNRATFRNSTT